VRRLRGPLLAVLAIVTAQWACPPWFGTDSESGGRRHASLGHHWRRAPPSAEHVCAAILERQLQSGDPDRIACPPPPTVA